TASFPHSVWERNCLATLLPPLRNSVSKAKAFPNRVQGTRKRDQPQEQEQELRISRLFAPGPFPYARVPHEDETTLDRGGVAGLGGAKLSSDHLPIRQRRRLADGGPAYGQRSGQRPEED